MSTVPDCGQQARDSVPGTVSKSLRTWHTGCVKPGICWAQGCCSSLHQHYIQMVSVWAFGLASLHDDVPPALHCKACNWLTII